MVEFLRCSNNFTFKVINWFSNVIICYGNIVHFTADFGAGLKPWWSWSFSNTLWTVLLKSEALSKSEVNGLLLSSYKGGNEIFS